MKDFYKQFCERLIEQIEKAIKQNDSTAQETLKQVRAELVTLIEMLKGDSA